MTSTPDSDSSPNPSSRQQTITVDEAASGKRLDALLAERFPEYSRARISELIEAGEVQVSGTGPSKLKRSLKLSAGMQVSITLPDTNMTLKLAGNPDLQAEVLFEDEHLVVFAKPASMAVHPQKHDATDTLANLLIARYDDQLPYADEAGLMPGIVHRLDAGTSGVIVCARTQTALDELKRQFREREVEKHYLAIVHTDQRKIRDSGEIDSPLERDPTRGHSMRINKEKGRPALTRYQTRQRFQGFAYVDIWPQTGRTHQIRVHLASRGWPVVADHLYSPAGSIGLEDLMQEGEPVRGGREILKRQALHALSLKLKHPASGEPMVFEAELPDDMEALLMALRIHRLGLGPQD